ncbi:unnamed protein product [Sphagnum tenellum]
MASSETVSITMDFLEESAAIPELLRKEDEDLWKSLQQIVRKELEGIKLEISVAQLWLHLAIWYQAYCNVGEAGKTQGFSIVDVQAVTFNWLLENMPPEYGKSNLQDLFNITPAQAEVVDNEQEDFDNERQEPAETDHNTIFQQSCNNHQAV